MIIEVENRDKEYALDVTNVILCDLKLEEDPWFKIRNHRRHWIIYFVSTTVCFIASMIYVICFKSIILGICTALLIFCAARAYGYIYASGKLMRELQNRGKSTYTFSKDGVECDNHEQQKVTFQWDYFRYIKRYRSGLFFIPKKKAASILAVPIRYENEIRDLCVRTRSFWIFMIKNANLKARRIH